LCVHQTVVDLLRRGLSVHLAVDAVGSLDPVDREIGVRRALSGGAHASSVEMALFELPRGRGQRGVPGGALR
jgi:nicotinamidase-related amidase